MLKWELQIVPKKIQREDSVNYLGYKIGLQKIRTQTAQIRRNQLRTPNDFQWLLGITPDLIVHLNRTSDDDKDLNSPRESTAEVEKKLTIVEEKIQKAHVDRVNPNLNYILAILPSRISPTGILMQRDNIILEWTFFVYHINQGKIKNSCGKSFWTDYKR